MTTVAPYTHTYSIQLLRYYNYIPYATHYIFVTYFITGSLYFLISFTCFTHLPKLVLSGNHQFVLYIWICLFCVICYLTNLVICYFWSHISEIVWSLYFSVCFISLIKLYARSIHCWSKSWNFIVMAGWHFIEYTGTAFSLFIHLLTDT